MSAVKNPPAEINTLPFEQTEGAQRDVAKLIAPMVLIVFTLPLSTQDFSWRSTNNCPGLQAENAGS